jgi:hypothetical protein
MKLLTPMLRKQAGQALPMVLVLLALGAMIIVPTLVLTTTNLKATRVVDQKTREVYAADAGIEHALWHLQSEQRLALIPDSDWPKNYNLSDDVNAKEVSVTIEPAWLLSNLPDLGLPQDEPPECAPNAVCTNANNHWTVIGAINIDNTHNYVVDIATSESANTVVDHIAVWLPQGYSYAPNSVKINGVDHVGNALVKEPDAQLSRSYRGGTALIWNYLVTNTTFKQLSDIAPGGPPTAKFPPSIRLSFNYNVTPFVEAKGFFPWMKLLSGNRVAWDSDAGFYHVESTGTTPQTGTSTTVEAYVPKGVKRYVSGSSGATSAIQGDYIAIGNSLMTCCWNSAKTGPPSTGQPCSISGNPSACTSCCGTNPFRNYDPTPVIFTATAGYADGERESYATVNPGGVSPNVPSDAKIERAYLYWTAWLRGDTLWTDKGNTWNINWNQYMGSNWDNATQVPSDLKGLSDWVKANAFDGKAYLVVNDTKVEPKNAADLAGTVVADESYISKGSSNVQPSYQYACFADVTDQVKKVTDVLSGTKFTVAGVHAHPAIANGGDCTHNKPTIDWSRSPNAGWSMVIIYSSQQPEAQVHQIFLYRGCQHLFQQDPIEFTMPGFAVPDVTDNEAKMTVFASEGDVNSPPAEYLGFKGQQDTAYNMLYDVSNTGDVFNSTSSTSGFTPSSISTCQTGVGIISGIDIDTYTATKPTGGKLLSDIVKPLDTSASIKVESPRTAGSRDGVQVAAGEGFEVIYVVFSVRSTAIPAGQEFDVGTMMYRIQ